MSNSCLINKSQLFSSEHNIDGDPKTDLATRASESDEEYENDIKRRILNESLKFVGQFGWSKEAICAGAESINYPGIIHGMFPNGGADLIDHFNSTCNSTLNEEMEKYTTKRDTNVPRPEPNVIIEEAIHKRLEMIIPYKQKWPEAIAIMTLPSNISIALSNITTIVDNICFYAGDQSVDFSWYIKRLGVAGIYKSTELYFVQDNSEDYQKTWEFLNRRVSDAMELNKIRTNLVNIPPPEKLISQSKDLTSAIFRTAQNICGFNWRH